MGFIHIWGKAFFRIKTAYKDKDIENMYKINCLQRRTEAHDIDAQLNALRELQMQPAFIAGRQAVRNKDRQSGLWTQNYMSWCHRIIEIFKSFCRMMFLRRDY